MDDDKKVSLNSIADKATSIAIKQLDAGLNFRQPRMAKIKLIEDMYNMVERPALVGRYSVPFDGVVMRGYVDTLMSKIDDTTSLQFKKTKGSALKAAKKITAAWEKESSPERSNWKLHDRWAKKQMCMTGRAYLKAFGEAPFRFNIENVDHYDMVTEPNGGGHLDNHLFTYQINIFKSNSDLNSGVKSGRYDKSQVQKLQNKVQENDFKQNDDDYQNKVSRFASLGLDAESNNYVGGKLFNLTEGVMTYDGERYYILFDRKSGIWIRFELLEKVFKSKLIPWTSYSSDDDAFSFLNLGPADPIYPVAESMYLNLNGMLNNMRKKNDDMIIYDSKIITNPADLIYRPDGLIAAALNGADIRTAVMNMRPDDITNLAMNMHGFLNAFLGENTGITAGAKGSSDEDKVGIYLGNMQQVADRIGRYNKSYSSNVEEIGRRFDWALYEHASEDYMVQILGEDGIEWARITEEDKDPDFEVAAIGGSAERQMNEIKAAKQAEVMKTIVSTPDLMAVSNKKVLLRELAETADMDESKIQALLNVSDESDDLVLSEAERMIENCLNNKQLELYQGADTAFVQHILDYSLKNRMETYYFMKLQALIEAHMPIVVQNMTRRAMIKPQLPAGQVQNQPGAPINPPAPAVA